MGFPTDERARASRLTINFEIFDLRLISRAFQFYACEQWPPTPKHYIYSTIYLVNACTHPSCTYICMHNVQVPARSHSVACIYLLHFLSVAINFRSTFSLLNTPRKNEEEEPRRKCRQLHRDFAHHESFAKTAR